MRTQWTVAIFKRLQARYGTKWVASIDGIEEEAIEEWSKGLAGLTADQIAHGLKSWQSDWPPSMSEFVKACKDIKAACHKPFPKLEVLKSDKITAKEAINNMKKLYLGGAK